jgi:hypothetical protein
MTVTSIFWLKSCLNCNKNQFLDLMCADCSSSFDFVGSEQFPFVWGGLVHPRSSFST